MLPAVRVEPESFRGIHRFPPCNRAKARNSYLFQRCTALTLLTAANPKLMKTSSAIKFSTLLVLLLISVVLGADLDHMEWRNPFPTGNSLFAVTFGASKFIAAGEFGIAATSPDGVNWTSMGGGGISNTIYALTFGGDLFVAVGDEGRIFTSADGVVWTARNSGTTNRLTGVTYGNGIYVAVGAGNTTTVSSDGVNWNSYKTSNVQLVDLAFGNGIFAATTSGHACARSADGVQWTAVELPHIEYELRGVVFGNGTFVAGGTSTFSRDSVHWTSTNGLNWQFGYGGGEPLTYGKELFVSISGFDLSSPTVSASTDGSNWVGTASAASRIHAGAFGNEHFVLVGVNGLIMASSNVLNWSGATWSHDLLTDIQYANGVYVAIGGFWPYTFNYAPPGPTVLVSSNGGAFAPITTTISQPVAALAVGNGNFVAVCKGGGIYRSTNGLNWTARSSGTLRDLHGITRGNGFFVAVGHEGTILTSPEGLVWTLRFSGSASPLFGVTYANNLYVAVGYFGTILTSPDAITWTVQFSDTPNALFSVAGRDGLFVTTGEAGTILTSGNGTDWTQRDAGTSMHLYRVASGDGIFVAVGRNGSPQALQSGNVLLSSVDGVSWVHHGSRAVSGLLAAAYLNGLFWVAGENGVIMASGIATQLQLTGQWQAGGTAFELRSIGGDLNRVYHLQTRTSLDSAWTDLTTLTNSAAGMYFLDQRSMAEPSGFYRLTSP